MAFFSSSRELVRVEGDRIILSRVAFQGPSVGLEFSADGIRAAMISCEPGGTTRLEALEKVSGPLVDDAAQIEGLRRLRDKLPSGAGETFTTCLAGRGVFAGVMALPLEKGKTEAAQAREKLGAHFPFAAANPALDVQTLSTRKSGRAATVVAVGAVHRPLLDAHLGLLERAGIRPQVIDLVPFALGNLISLLDGAGDRRRVSAAVFAGSRLLVVALEGGNESFYARSIPLSAPASGAPEANPLLEAEIRRTLAHYRTEHRITQIGRVFLTGPAAASEMLRQDLEAGFGVAPEHPSLSRLFGRPAEIGHQRYDLPILLALRGML